MLDEILKQLTALQKQVDNLVKPEVSTALVSGVNLLTDTLAYNASWPSGVTLNDVTDAAYGPAMWRVLNSGNAPDISGQAGSSPDPFFRSFRCTFDTNTQQAGIVQFLTHAKTVGLRGKTVSLSADLWGTNVSNMRMTVIYWTGTADAPTADIVSSWGANPTLVTDWNYIDTPVSIAITSTRDRYKRNNITVPDTANNVGVFIWTPDSEDSGDLWNVARVKLEQGPVATEYIGRGQEGEHWEIQPFVQLLDPVSNAANHGLGVKSATTTILVYSQLLRPMRVTPTLSHNITGYTAGAPGTTTIALVNLTTVAFYAITGALTVALSSATTQDCTLVFTAGTSWDGTVGNIATLRVGPSVVLLLEARL